MAYKDTEKLKEYQRKWQEENKERRTKELKVLNRKGHLKKRYNLTPEQYQETLEAQKYRCAICGKHEKDNKKGEKQVPLAVDHCHTKKSNRGLLCNTCNLGLGYFKDKTEFLLKAVDYLHKHMI
jgi:nitrate/TMAO reductase-like tetraheme cytochrome c subunit